MQAKLFQTFSLQDCRCVRDLSFCAKMRPQLRPWPPQGPMQAVRERGILLHARPAAVGVPRLRRLVHLPARPAAGAVPGVRRGVDLRPRAGEGDMPRVRRPALLRPRHQPVQVPGVPPPGDSRQDESRPAPGRIFGRGSVAAAHSIAAAAAPAAHPVIRTVRPAPPLRARVCLAPAPAPAPGLAADRPRRAVALHSL